MGTPPIEEVDNRTVIDLIRALADREQLRFASCLDIGCGRSRYDRWFNNFPYATGPRRYIGLDTDPAIVQELNDEGVDARNPAADAGECRSDLVLCIEVLEHVSADNAIAFLEFAKRQTGKVLALTTPDFEYWEGRKQRPEYKECRWIPDHLPSFNPQNSGDPHVHRHAVTPTLVREYFARVFDADEWRYRVYRAWPWLLRDLSIGVDFTFYFKVFALAWRVDDRP